MQFKNREVHPRKKSQKKLEALPLRSDIWGAFWWRGRPLQALEKHYMEKTKHTD